MHVCIRMYFLPTQARECFHKALQLFPEQAVQINNYL